MTMVIVDMIGKAYCGIEFNDRTNPKNEICELFRYLLGEKDTHTFGTYNVPRKVKFTIVIYTTALCSRQFYSITRIFKVSTLSLNN